MIYAAQPLSGGPVKIGYSVDVPSRIRQLEAHYGQPLALLATMDGGPDEERAIHARFSSLRLGRTEQFRPAPDLMAFLGRPLLVSPNPDAVEAMPIRASRKPIVFGLRGSEEYKAWLDGLAQADATDLSELAERAFAAYARQIGYAHPRPKR